MIKTSFKHLGEKKDMFKKKDIAIAMRLAMTVSQPVLSQGESAATSTAEVPAASGPATGAPEAGTIGGVPVATAVAYWSYWGGRYS